MLPRSCSLLAAFLLLFSPSPAAGPFLANGLKIGEVDQTSALVWVRLTRDPAPAFDLLPIFTQGLRGDQPDAGEMPAGVLPGAPGQVRLTWWPAEAQSFSLEPAPVPPASALSTPWMEVDPERDFTVQIPLTGLQPGTPYALHLEARPPTPPGAPASTSAVTLSGRFHTAFPRDAAAPVRFIVTTCQAIRSIDDGPEGHSTYRQMLAFQPHFFVHTGDIVYYDKAPLAQSVPSARAKWNLMFAYGHNRRFHQLVSSYFQKDDHDTLKNDCWPGQTYGDLTFDQGLALFQEQVPLGALPYRTVRWGRHLQIWLLENRDFRTPNNLPDGPAKTILGPAQKAWLKESLLASDATYKFVLSPGPFVGPDKGSKADNHANPGFLHEGREMRAFFAALPNTYVICGDRHWQYCSQDPATGLLELGCGPINDEHNYGGDPGYHPDFHRFFSPLGGFLGLTVTAAQATAEWFGRDPAQPHAPTPVVRYRETLAPR